MLFCLMLFGVSCELLCNVLFIMSCLVFLVCCVLCAAHVTFDVDHSIL